MFGVYRAYIERNTAIQRLQNLLKKYIDVRTVCQAIQTAVFCSILARLKGQVHGSAHAH